MKNEVFAQPCRGRFSGWVELCHPTREIKNYIGEYIQVYDTYELEQEKGICLELEVMMSGMIDTTH